MKGEEIYKSHHVRLEDVYADSIHPHENLVIMNKFIRRKSHSGLSPESIKTYISTFVIFSKWCTVPIIELTEDDIYDFLDYLHEYTYQKKGNECHYSPVSINTYKINLRTFFGSLKRQDLVEPLKERGKGNKKVLDKNQLPTIEDVETLIKFSMNSRDRAIVSSIYEAGPRQGELLSVQRKHIAFDNVGVLITFPEGKTGPRTVRLVYAASYLRTWVDDHPVKGPDGRMDQEAYLFVSLEPKTIDGGTIVYSQLSSMGLYKQLKKIAKRAGITKKVNPHSFRHSRATELAEHLTEQQMKKYLGWKEDSKMCAVYIHDVDTDKAILNMHGITIEETHVSGLKVGKCPKCKMLNAEIASFCSVCGFPLNQDALNTISEHEKHVSLILEVFGKLATGEVSVEDVKEEVKRQNKKRD